MVELPVIDATFGVVVAENSANSKMSAKRGSVATTQVSLDSCPPCKLKDLGICYTLYYHTRRIVDRMGRSGITDKLELAKNEAQAIRHQLSGTKPLRLHVAGDCANSEAARIVSSACREYMKRHGQVVWTYTHAKDVPREAWGPVSILRSCEEVEEVQEALEAGYAAAMVVPEFKQETAYEIAPGITGIPCPFETSRKLTCDRCRLCWNDQKLHKNKQVVLFQVHGLVPTIKMKKYIAEKEKQSETV